ncbi:MAG TPA: ABC transporter permease [Tepidisphaeraceae bacterium]|nr:ABC transporter permease [Tepidisphaeraceae bacterium]
MTTTSAPAPQLTAQEPHAAVPQRIILRPKAGWQALDLAELWHYRELLWILALRDIKVRYKQTALGAAWAIIQPFLTMLVFTVFFAGYGKLPTDGVPPQVFYFCGLLPWQLFANSLTNAGNSLVGNQNLITKVYFPRLVMPASAVITGLVDFAIAFVVMLGLMAWYHVMPGWQIIFMPVFVLLAFFAALAVGLWFSALNVEFRDVRYVLPFLTQFWLFVTPIVYPSSIVTSPWKRMLLGINPMSGVVEGFRWSMLGRPTPGPLLAVSIATIGITLVGGLFYFRRMEKTFADRV